MFCRSDEEHGREMETRQRTWEGDGDKTENMGGRWRQDREHGRGMETRQRTWEGDGDKTENFGKRERQMETHVWCTAHRKWECQRKKNKKCKISCSHSIVCKK
jgi:hypothetical protein